MMNKRLRAYRRRAVTVFMALGFVAGALIGFALDPIDGPGGRGWFNGMIVGVLAGLAVGSAEEYLIPGLGRRLGFAALNSVRLGIHALGMTLAVFAGNVIPHVLLDGTTPWAAVQDYTTHGHPFRDLAIGLAAAGVLTFLLQLRRLHNREELWHLFTGRYHSPRLERRVFLFVDLADSTGIAEALGATTYSAFLRDVFREMSEPILARRGLVYQHAGDALIVSWPHARGVEDGACVRCFTDMEDALRQRAPEFRRRYDRVPRIRGAVHCGPVVTTWVGEAKRELAFHGDTVNTVARLQGLASSLDRTLLVSGDLHSQLALPGYRTERLGDFGLRGPQAALDVHAVVRLEGEGRVASSRRSSDVADDPSSASDPPSDSQP